MTTVTEAEHIARASRAGVAAVLAANLTAAGSIAITAQLAGQMSAPLPDDIKKALKPYVHQITEAVFALVKTGVDVALLEVPFIGAAATPVVNSIIDALEPEVETKLNQFLS